MVALCSCLINSCFPKISIIKCITITHTEHTMQVSDVKEMDDDDGCSCFINSCFPQISIIKCITITHTQHTRQVSNVKEMDDDDGWMISTLYEDL